MAADREKLDILPLLSDKILYTILPPNRTQWIGRPKRRLSPSTNVGPPRNCQLWVGRAIARCRRNTTDGQRTRKAGAHKRRGKVCWISSSATAADCGGLRRTRATLRRGTPRRGGTGPGLASQTARRPPEGAQAGAPGARCLFANENNVYGILLMKEPRANVTSKGDAGSYKGSH